MNDIFVRYKDLIFFLTLGTSLMLLVSLLRRKRYKISIPKIIILMLALTFTGVAGAFILFYIENGFWGGQSYFGAVLITPLLMIPFAYLLKIPVSKVLSICAPAECIMLGTLKVNCLNNGCCGGSLFYEELCPVPLQLLEALAAFVIAIILIWIETKNNETKYLYAYYLVIYGIVRFVMNFFRDGLSPYVLILPPGHFWALVSILIGTIILSLKNKGKCHES